MPASDGNDTISRARCAENDLCAVCSTSKCNGNVHPEDRLHCLHCAGENCVNQTDTVDVRYPCVRFVDQDNCYSVFSQGNQSIIYLI